MGSFDNKDELVGRFCDRADENSEIPETASGAVRRGASAHHGSRVADQACRDLLQMLYRPRCIAGALSANRRRDPGRDGPPPGIPVTSNETACRQSECVRRTDTSLLMLVRPLSRRASGAETCHLQPLGITPTGPEGIGATTVNSRTCGMRRRRATGHLLPIPHVLIFLCRSGVPGACRAWGA
jgi:hypothetical protein